MFRFFKSNALVGFGDFRISFTVGLAAHRQIHADFRTFSGEIFSKPLDDFFVKTFGHADFVFVSPNDFSAFFLFFFQFELGFWRFALRANFRRFFSKRNVTANSTDPNFHSCLLVVGFMESPLFVTIPNL